MFSCRRWIVGANLTSTSRCSRALLLDPFLFFSRDMITGRLAGRVERKGTARVKAGAIVPATRVVV